MTRAKPKPTIAIREPDQKLRAESAAIAERAPAKPVSVKKTAASKPPTKSKPTAALSAKAKPPVKEAASPTSPPAKRNRAAADNVATSRPAKLAAGKASAKSTPTPAAATKASASKASAKTASTKVARADEVTPPKTSSVKATAEAAPSPKAPSNKRPAIIDTPAKIRPIEQAVGVSSDAVARRTGKSWAQWFALLDAAGAAELDHKGIVAVLAQRHGVGPWWQQTVTVAYEQARGRNGNAATDDGFQVDVSKVLELPLAKLFRFWAEPAERNKWLADDRFSIHKATASKSIRARWGRGVSRIDVDFCEKGPSKSQVTVQHNRIESSDAAEQMKAYWAKKIRALEALTRP